jgi:AcrR family transcriptional regulator
MEVTGVRRLTPQMRRDQTRAYLLEAAAAVFAAKGFHTASLDEIAEAAGFTKGAIYSNFGGKAELFLALVDQRRAAMVAEFFPASDPSLHPDPAELLESISDVYRRLTPTETEYALWAEFELYALRNPELRQRINRDNRQRFDALVAVVTQQLTDLGVANPALHPETLTRLYIAVFDSLARQRALDPDGVPDALFATLVTFLNDAVRHTSTPSTDTTPPPSTA